ncbi:MULTISPECIES: DUF1120 domain-containing protein [unclassified Pseudomonas]|uniref:DUF1120 domain-containing protein n=1 Tax=Pseudomonas sp. MYb327 TaxID=2745230 RepID=A0AAU8E2P5_9PSED
MKKYLAALSATALIGVAPYALASSTDLTVTGIITPAACSPSLSEGGQIELGKIPSHTLNPTSDTLVGQNTLQLTVACDAPTLLALNAIDHMAGTSINYEAFGVGLTEADEKLGGIILRVNNPLADGQRVEPITSPDGGASWEHWNVLTPSNLLSFAHHLDLGTPIPLKDLDTQFSVLTHIAPANGLTLNDDQSINGEVTIEVMYL